MKHECKCTKDEDGRCESCIAEISDLVGRMLQQTISSLKAIDAISEEWTRTCCVCSRDNLDYALAKVANAIIADAGILSDQKYSGVLRDTFKQLMEGVGEDGPQKWPLTEKALLKFGEIDEEVQVSDPKTGDPVEVVENEKEQQEGYATVWCVRGIVRIQNNSVDTGDPELRESPYVFNVVARSYSSAVNAYFGKVAEMSRLGDLVAQVRITSVKWVARVDSD